MTATNTMPPWIHHALEAHLEGVSRKELAQRAQAISERYRNNGGSESIRRAQDALAYALVRMPATYAAARHAILQAAARCPSFAPVSILDIGSGPGTATWAALDAWPTWRQAALVDHNPHLLALARHIAARSDEPRAVDFVSGAIPAAFDAAKVADVVLASYALTEIAASALTKTLDQLWKLTNHMLILVEPGTTNGFRRLLQCRESLLAHQAHIVAPCTHQGACPLAKSERWCHFSQRLSRRRDHLLVKSASVNYEDEKFAYLIACKTEIAANPAPRRILSTPHVHKGGVRLTLCAAGNVEEHEIPRGQKDAYKAARHYEWGDAVEL